MSTVLGAFEGAANEEVERLSHDACDTKEKFVIMEEVMNAEEDTTDCLPTNMESWDSEWRFCSRYCALCGQSLSERQGYCEFCHCSIKPCRNNITATKPESPTCGLCFTEAELLRPDRYFTPPGDIQLQDDNSRRAYAIKSHKKVAAEYSKDPEAKFVTEKVKKSQSKREASCSRKESDSSGEATSSTDKHTDCTSKDVTWASDGHVNNFVPLNRNTFVAVNKNAHRRYFD